MKVLEEVNRTECQPPLSFRINTGLPQAAVEDKVPLLKIV